MLGRLLCPYTFQDLKQFPEHLHRCENKTPEDRGEIISRDTSKANQKLWVYHIKGSQHWGNADLFVLEAQELTAKNICLALFSIHLYK